jgi:hypothetical protein
MSTEMERLEMMVKIVKNGDSSLSTQQIDELEREIFFYKTEIRRGHERLKREDQGQTVIRAEKANINNMRIVGFNSVLDLGTQENGGDNHKYPGGL